MIKVRLSQVYNNHPYYTITQNGKIYNAFGTEQVMIILKDIRKGREKIDIESIESLIEEHTKLCELLK